MRFTYLDASAWVKRYVREHGTTWIQEFFAQSPLLACASLGYIEVMANLSRKRKAGEISDSAFEAALRSLEQDWNGFTEIRLGDETMALAVGVVRQFALRGADTVHLASALLLRQRLGEEDEMVLVAADEDLKAAARTSGLVALDPGDEEQRGSLT